MKLTAKKLAAGLLSVAAFLPLTASACHDGAQSQRHVSSNSSQDQQDQAGDNNNGQNLSLDQDKQNHGKNFVPGHFAMVHNKKVWIPAHYDTHHHHNG